jgi:hypothetical protein
MYKKNRVVKIKESHGLFYLTSSSYTILQNSMHERRNTVSQTVTVDFLYKNELFDYLQLRINIPSAMESLNMMNSIPI